MAIMLCAAPWYSTTLPCGLETRLNGQVGMDEIRRRPVWACGAGIVIRRLIAIPARLSPVSEQQYQWHSRKLWPRWLG